MTDGLLDSSIADLVRAQAEERTSAEEIAGAVLARIDATEPEVGAFEYVDRDQTMERARALDALRASGRTPGPLHGVPVNLKDIVDVAGMPTTASSRAYGRRWPRQSSAIASGLLEAGALIVGKAVTHELAWGVGRPPTRAPWLGKDVYPGGSSVGTAVSVATGTSLAGIGSDSGGSIRVPSTIHGLVGFKPSRGLIDRRGTVTLSSTLDHFGPIARTVGDASVVLAAIARRHGAAAGALEPGSAIRSLEGVRMGLYPEFCRPAHIDPAIEACFDRTVDRLGERGAEIVELDDIGLAAALPAGLTYLAAEGWVAHQALYRASGEVMQPEPRQRIAAASAVPAEHYIAAAAVRRHLIERLARDADEHRLDVMISPTASAFTTGYERLRVPGEHGLSPIQAMIFHTYLANLTGLPAITIPVHRAGSLPLGLQLHGRRLDDGRVLAVARECERVIDDNQENL